MECNEGERQGARDGYAKLKGGESLATKGMGQGGDTKLARMAQWLAPLGRTHQPLLFSFSFLIDKHKRQDVSSPAFASSGNTDEDCPGSIWRQ